MHLSALSSLPARLVQLLREYESDPSGWAEPGPTRATAVVACIPAFMDASGHSTGELIGRSHGRMRMGA